MGKVSRDISLGRWALLGRGLITGPLEIAWETGPVSEGTKATRYRIIGGGDIEDKPMPGVTA